MIRSHSHSRTLAPIPPSHLQTALPALSSHTIPSPPTLPCISGTSSSGIPGNAGPGGTIKTLPLRPSNGIGSHPAGSTPPPSLPLSSSPRTPPPLPLGSSPRGLAPPLPPPVPRSPLSAAAVAAGGAVEAGASGSRDVTPRSRLGPLGGGGSGQISARGAAQLAMGGAASPHPPAGPR